MVALLESALTATTLLGLLHLPIANYYIRFLVPVKDLHSFECLTLAFETSPAIKARDIFCLGKSQVSVARKNQHDLRK